MSVETVGWMLLAVLILLPAFEIWNVFARRERRQFRRGIARIFRQELEYLPFLIRLVEDLIRIEPEREESLQVARLELIRKQADFQKVVDRLDRKNRWWD